MRPGPGVAIALAVLSGLAAGCLNTFEEPPKPHYVRIVNLELAPARILSQEVVLNVTAFLDNRGGGASDPVRLHAKAFDEATSFLIAESEVPVGVVPGDTTRPVTTQLRVPREGGVRIDVSLFEADLGRQTASVTARNLGSLEPEVLDTGLRISDVDFLVRGVTPGGPGGSDGGDDNRSGRRATIQADLYVTNEGEATSEDLRVQVKARESSTRLVTDVGWVTTGAIQPGATVIRSVNLTVPDGYNYVFEILTWRGETIVARSEGVVQLAPTYVKPTDQEVVTERPNVQDFVSPTISGTRPPPGAEYAGGFAGAPSPEVPGFGAGALLAAAAAAAASLLVLRSRRRAP